MIQAGSFHEALNFPPAGHFLFGFEAAASPRSSMVDILNNAHLRKKLIISVVRNLEAVSVQITDESVRLEPLGHFGLVPKMSAFRGSTVLYFTKSTHTH